MKKTLRLRSADRAEYEPFDDALVVHFTDPFDHEQYRALVELGVKAGDSLAQYAKATWFIHGEDRLGIRRNIRRAVPLLTEASRTLNRAMYDLGVCYMLGSGVPRDDRRAYLLFSKAAKHGSIAGMFNQAYFLEFGIGVTRSYARSRRIMKVVDALRASWPSKPEAVPAGDGPDS